MPTTISAEPLPVHLRRPFRIAHGTSTVRTNALVSIAEGVGEAGLPPYSHQVLIRAEAHRIEDPVSFLEEGAVMAREVMGPGVELWGPVPAPMERRAGRFRAHLLLQSESRPGIQALLAHWLPELRRLKSSRRVRWSVDVDPQEML